MFCNFTNNPRWTHHGRLYNGSIHMQMFCGVLIDPSSPIRDGKIVSAIRNRLAPALDMVRQQSVLYKKWESLLKDKDLCISDATCYESHLRYPTDRLIPQSQALLITFSEAIN